MARSVLFVLGSLACAFLQARVLPEIGLDRLLNLPLILSALFATPYQLPSRLAGATAAGLTLDALLMRPFGVTSLALCAAVLVGSALRSDVEGWPRRFAARWIRRNGTVLQFARAQAVPGGTRHTIV